MFRAMPTRELIVTVDGRERTVVVDGQGPELVVTIDGEARKVDARLVRPGTWSLLLDGRSFVVDLDPRRGGTVAASVASAAGGEAVLKVEDARQRRLARAAGSGRAAPRGEAIRAPIAGKVVKLAVAIGDTVAAGHAVVVLEAMKMENELVAERGGTVTAVHKQPGQAVDTGDLLVELA
jgi:biotin carboxyl carrier protein